MKRIPCAVALVGLALAAVAGCDSTPHALPCPGEVVGTFRFRGALPDAGSADACPFNQSALDFTGTIASGDPGKSLLCLDRAEAAPLTGSNEGDHVTVTAPTPAAAGAQTIAACACAVTVSETIEGDLVRTDGVVTGFAGHLRATVAPGSGATAASCERTPATPGCGVPCVQSWSLTTAP